MIVPWTKIENFNNIRKYTSSIPIILNGKNKVKYRCKVKLHGINAAIQNHKDGKIVSQSRTVEITPKSDNAGFAKWVDEIKELLNQKGVIIYGEWCGPGVQQGVSVSDIPSKIFAVFAARNLNDDGTVVEDSLIVEPTFLSTLVDGVPGAYVLPWHSVKNDAGEFVFAEVEVDWNGEEKELTTSIATINQWVIDVEKNDPWVQHTFGVSGTGEGLVFYPDSYDHRGYTNFRNLTFKAKGEAHRVVKSKAPAQLNAEVAATSEAFASMVLTLARLEQGATVVSGNGTLTFDKRFIKPFMDWITKDVQKETVDELEASGLEWEQVQKPVADKARAWYLSQIKR